MAAHSAEVGLHYQLTTLAAGAFLTWASIWMIARASIDTGRWSYEDISEELFHPTMSFLTGAVNVCQCLGSGAGYLIACGQVFQVAVGADEATRRLFVLSVGTFVCAPIALARHVSFLRHLAAISIVALLLLLVTMLWYLGKHGLDESVTPDAFWFGPGSASIFTYMNAMSNVVFAYNNQFIVPQLIGELTPEPTMRRVTVASVITVVMCFVLFSSVSIFGVLAFGVGEDQRDSLLLDLFPERKNPLVIASLIAVVFSVLTCFQFHVYPIRQFATFAIRKARGRGPDAEASDVLFCGRTCTRWLDMASALGSVAIIILIAEVTSELKTVLDFIGAFASAYTSYIVPPLWVIQILRRQENFSWQDKEAFGCLALLSLGVFFFAFGTLSAITDAFV
mmetsp:Transcript_78221/g.203253  ORF Transcript_78221/g.203253 Transcript_78221/m.203253 type:complete len:394 (+) Transcript_78221:3-1184(+)